MKINTHKYIEEFEKIKSVNGQIIPFVFRPAQERLYQVVKSQKDAGKPVRIIILKGRQMGISTLVEAILFKETATNAGIKSGIITHQEKSTKAIFEMVKTFYYNLPLELRPEIQASNSTELIFDTKDKKGLGSGISVMTAGMEGIGRGETFQFLHISEYAFWKCKGSTKEDQLRGLLQAVPNTPNSMIFIESTANGFEEFRKRWYESVEGMDDPTVEGFIPVFFPWFELIEYKAPYTGFLYNQDERELAKKYNLSPEQLQWRRWCIKNNCGGDKDFFLQEYPCNPNEAFRSTADCYFNKEKIYQQIDKLKGFEGKIKSGFFEYQICDDDIDNISFHEKENGFLKIYEEPNPNHFYVIGADTSGDGSDYFVAQVIDNCTGYQVATLRQQFDEDLFAEQMYCLGFFYNEALVAIETNFSTYPQKRLQRLGYEKFYIRQREDTFTQAIIKSYGFRTTTRTRPNMLGNLQKIFREEIDCIRDMDTLLEALTFVKNDVSKPVALAGYHDDCIMSLAIAFYIRDQQETVPLESGNGESINDFINNFKVEEGESEEWGY